MSTFEQDVQQLASELLDFHSGHGDFKTAGKSLQAIIDKHAPEPEPVGPKEGSLCWIDRDTQTVEHREPCSIAGKRTDIRTGRVIR